MKPRLIVKTAAAGLVCAVILILLYSEGFLYLRPGDASVMRAAFFYVGIIMIPVAYILYIHALLTPKRHVYISAERQVDMSAEFHNYEADILFSEIAQSAQRQIARSENLMKKIKEILNRRFEKESITYMKFVGITGNAQKALNENFVHMLNMMRIIESKEYVQLQHYQEDNIPDDIQLKRKELYEKKVAQIKERRNKNETLLYKMDELMLELANSEISEASDIASIAEVEELISQLSFYK